MAQISLSTEQKQTPRLREQTCGCQRGGERGGSGINWEFRVSRYKLLHIEGISNEFLQDSRGSYSQSVGIDHDGR